MTNILTYEEQTAVDAIRATVQLDPYPDPAVVLVVQALSVEAHALGLPYNDSRVLAALYPGWQWVKSQEVLCAL